MNTITVKEAAPPPAPTIPTISQYCRQQFWWNTAVKQADSVERYEDVLDLVLEGGKLDLGHKLVLDIYTRDVCAHHLPIATAIWSLYTQKNQCHLK